MNWIGILISLLKVLTVLVSILIVFVVLLQRPKNEGLGAAFGGDTASNIFGAQTTNVLATLTRWLGGIFLGLCLLIAVLGTYDKDRNKLIGAAIDKSNSERAAREKQEADRKAAEEAAGKVKSAEDTIKDGLKNVAPGVEVKKVEEKPQGVPTPVVQPKPEPGPAPAAPTAPDAIKPAPAPAEKPAESKL